MARPDRRFTFLLAGHLGLTVEELLSRMSSAELAEWRAYYELEPFGENWKQTAYVCSMIGNSAGGRRNGKAFTPADFLPTNPQSQSGPVPGSSIRNRARRMTGEQILSTFRAMASGNNRKSVS